MLERLGQKSASAATPAEAPDFVFYTGCNVLKTPHIALLALDIMDALGVTYQVMGGPSHCCGIKQLRTGDIEMSGRMGANSIEKMSHSKSGQVHLLVSELLRPVHRDDDAGHRATRRRAAVRDDALPAVSARATGSVDSRCCAGRSRCGSRCTGTPAWPASMEAAVEILQAIPGIELVDLQQPAVGLQSNNLRVLPAFKRELQRNELQAASDAGIDALVAVYHSDHRELCAHERDWPFRIINMLEVVGASMGLHRDDRYKELKLMQDADQIVAECKDLIAQHSLDAAAARNVIAKGMLGDQPLPLK